MSDARLIFDTALDTSGFDKGSEKLKQAIQDFVGKVGDAGNQIKNSFNDALSGDNFEMSPKTFDKYINDIQTRLSNAFGDMSKYTDKLSTVKTPEQATALMQGVEEARIRIENLQQEMNDLGGVVVNTEEFTKLYQECQQAEEAIRKLKAARDEAVAKAPDAYSAQAVEFQYGKDIQKAEAELAALAQKLKDVGEAGGSVLPEDSSRYQQLAAALQIAQNAYQDLAQSAQQANDRITQAAQAQAQARAEAQAQRQQQAQARAQAQAQRQQQQQAIAAARLQTQNARTASIQAQSFARSVQSALGMIGSAVNGAISAFARLASSAGSALQGVGSGVLGGISATMSRLSGVFGRATNVIKSFAGSLTGRMKSAFSSFKREGISAIPVADQVVKKIRSIRNILISRIKRTFISSWFNDMKAGVTSLAKHSAAFNAQMSSMQNSLKMMTANGTVAFGNFISAIQPMITTILNAISQAIVYLNAFFALLQGKSTMTVAKKQTASFGAAAGGAAKQVKELKNQVYGFDELNKRDKDNDDSGGGGGGGGAGDLFQDVPVESVLPEELMDYFNRIKEAIGMGEWEEVGSLIAEGMNFVLEKIDEAILSIYDKAIEWAGNIARILNGFVGTFDFPLLGKTIADGINLAFLVANEFITKFDWKQLGLGVAQGLNSLVYHVDFDLIGETLGMLLNGALHYLHTVLDNFKFDELGRKLAGGMNTFMYTVDWALLGSTLAGYVNGWTDLLGEFAESADWTYWGDSIGTAVTSFFQGVHWDESGETLRAWIDGISEIMWTLVENTEMWDSIDQAIEDFLTGLFDAESTAEALAGVLKFVGRVFETLGMITNKIPWKVIGLGVADGLNMVFDEKEAEKRGKTWSDTIEKFVEGVRTFIVEFDWKNAADSVSAFVKNLFDINWADMAFSVVLGLGSISYSISRMLKDITDDFPSIGQRLASGLNKIFGEDENGESFIKWDEIGNNFGTAFVNIIQGVATFLGDVDWGQIGKDIGTMLVNIPWGDIASSMWELFKNALKAAFNLVDGVTEAIAGHGKEWNLGGFGIGQSDVFLNDLRSAYDDSGFEKMGRESARSIFEGLRDGFTEGSEITAEQAIQAAILIGQGFENELLDLSPDLEWSGAHLLSSIYNSRTVDELVTNFSEAGISVSSSFAEALGGQGYENIMAAITLLGMGVDEKTVEALDLSNLDANLQSYMETTGASLQDVAETLMTGSEEAIRSIANVQKGEIFNSLDATMQETIDHLVNGSLSGKEQIAQAAYWMFMGYGDAIAEASPELAASANSLLEGVYNAQTADEVKAKFREAGIEITGNFAEALQGQGKENIAAALFLLGQGIDQSTVEALDLSNIDSNLQTYMENSGKTITEVAGDLAADAGEAIGKIVPEAAEKALDEGTAIVQSKSDGVADAADIGDKKAELEQSSKEAGEAVPGAAGQGMEENVGKVDKPVKDLIEAVEKPMEKLTPDQRKQAEEMMMAIDKMISDKNPVVEDTMKSAAEAVLAKAQESLNTEKGGQLAADFTGGIMTKIVKQQPNVERAMRTMAKGVFSQIQTTLNSTTGEEVATSFSDGVHIGVEKLSDIPEIIRGYTDTIEASVNTSKDNILSAVASFVQGVKDGVTGANIPGTFSSVANQAVSAMSSELSYAKGKQIGSNVAAGMKDGINGGTEGTTTAATDAAKKTASAVKDMLKISSPSKVFYEIGMYTMQGLTNGIKQFSGDAIDTVEATARAMTHEAEGTDIEFGMNATVNSLDAVAEKLGNVATVFREIATVFDTMGSAAIPSVANGTFIPYRTRVEDLSAEDTKMMTAAMTKATTDQTEVMEDQRDLIRELIGVVRGLKLTLDVDTITNAVTARQRTLDRNIGTVVI